MRILDAIRLGSRGTRKCKGEMFHGKNSCVMGAAYAGVEAANRAMKIPDQGRLTGLLPTWLEQARPAIACPVQGCGAMPTSAMAIAIHLNDHHDWTRVRIGKFITRFEPKETV